MKRMIILALALFLVFGVLVFAGGQKEPAKTDTSGTQKKTEEPKKVEPTVLKLGMIAPEGHPVEIGCKKFADLVKERTNGEVVIELYPNGQLGGEVEMQNAAKLGTIDMINVGCGITAGTVPQYNICSFHYVWKNTAHMLKVMNSDLVKGWDKIYLEKSGLRILASNWVQGNRQLVSKKPIHSVDDLKGLKIRVPQAETFIEAWKAMGANPTPMAFGEVYTALQQGVVDAVEVPLDWIDKMKFYEQAKYIILTGHLQYVNQMQINEKSFEKLSPENQKILEQAAIEAGDYSSKIGADMISKLRSSLEEKGAVFIEVDRSQFAKKVYSIVPKFEDQWGVGLWDKVQAMAD